MNKKKTLRSSELLSAALAAKFTSLFSCSAIIAEYWFRSFFLNNIMRFSVILFTLVIGGLISGGIFFVFIYPINEHVAVVSNHIEPLDYQRAFILPIVEPKNYPVRDIEIPEPKIEARAAVLYDAFSGRSLFGLNENRRLPIASVTKLMSAIVITETIDLNEIITMPAEVINVDGFGADFKAGEKLRGDDLLKIMLIKSSNDAALAFAAHAEKVGIDIVGKMNEKAAALGMNNTHFSDPAGLDDQGAFSTAMDLVKLLSYASDQTKISKILLTQVTEVQSIDGIITHNVLNTNQLLGKIPGIIVAKTGYTDNALGTMVMAVSGAYGEGIVISVILGSNNRFVDTIKLIEWGREAYSWNILTEK